MAGDGVGQVTTFAVPPNPGPASIAGSPLVGETLALTHRTVDTPGAWVSDRWWRCQDPGSRCQLTPISTSSTGYTLVADDTDHYVEARETFGFGFYASEEFTTDSIGPVCNGTCSDGGRRRWRRWRRRWRRRRRRRRWDRRNGRNRNRRDWRDRRHRRHGGGGDAPPILSGLPSKLPATRAGAPLKLTFTLAGEASAVKVTFARKTTGRRVGSRCVAQTRRNRRKRACSRYVNAGSKSFANLPAGANTLAVSTQIGGRKLKPGVYRVTVTSFDADGSALPPRTTTLKVTR